jgi:hypothetical protein
MHPNNEAQLYGLVEPNVHPQMLASSSQVNLQSSSADLGSPCGQKLKQMLYLDTDMPAALSLESRNTLRLIQKQIMLLKYSG